jgi:hypothetical protein
VVEKDRRDIKIALREDAGERRASSLRSGTELGVSLKIFDRSNADFLLRRCMLMLFPVFIRPDPGQSI